VKNLPPIYYQTAGIYYPAAWTGRLANPLPNCYRHRKICYRPIRPATDSTGNLPISNRPIIVRPFRGIVRFAEPAATIAATSMSARMMTATTTA